MAGEIADPNLRTQTLWTLATVAARDGLGDPEPMIADARQAAAKIATELDRTWTLAAVAVAVARVGQRSKADQLLAEALAGGRSRPRSRGPAR